MGGTRAAIIAASTVTVVAGAAISGILLRPHWVPAAARCTSTVSTWLFRKKANPVMRPPAALGKPKRPQVVSEPWVLHDAGLLLTRCATLLLA